MCRPLATLALLALAPAAFCQSRKTVELGAGEVQVHAEILVDANTELRGARAGTVLHAAAGFTGRAVIVVRGANVVLRDFTIDGNRAALAKPADLPPSDTPFARFTRANGVLAEGVSGLHVDNVRFRQIAGFAILVSRSNDVTIENVQVQSSGSRNAKGRNNTTGGILLEEGTIGFRVAHCALTDILGNGIWTHSLYRSPRNAHGVISGNTLSMLARDAIQVGHAIDVRVEDNSGTRIGFPAESVDTENQAIPVAIDTAGNVEQSVYARNHFEEIDGKCIDLDGFHDGDVRLNVCINRGAATAYPFGNYGIVMNNSNPDMQSRNIRVLENHIDGARYGGIFVIGTGHRVAGNQLDNLNTAHCGCVYDASQPDILAAGIYLGRGGTRPAPAAQNVIEGNHITGYHMREHCVESAPGVAASANTVRGNRCEDR